MFIEATLVGIHTWDRRKIAMRWSGVTAEAGLCPNDTHAPPTLVTATSMKATTGFMMPPRTIR
jgi:hypothetical protein